ncbi:hypothetical protein HG536_0C00940 [Torulaspora globosa]|uniref:DUF2415 domain-containing protein n=1 Tax=Torulaspora globosa TaxID=48254 RepID=A0A7G3ZEJ1_9SACH|nr:uncharacterized protein HG536_0C00940 [Torulaspora globosa]QLL31927.1 hypothetical protein HG536_0C00940 [Torulaspora globosa]
MTIDGSHRNSDELDDESLNTGLDKVYQNYMMPGLELYDAKISINHWQLRDCLRSSSKQPGKLLYIFDHSVRMLDTGQASTMEYYRHRKQVKSRRNSVSNARKSTGSRLRSSHNVPSQKLVEFNFKPRSFTESQGLIACGGLIGPDDKGFPTNWSRIAHEVNNGSPIPPPAEPVKLANRNVLADHSNYSNPSIWKGILSLHNTETGASSSHTMGQFINNCVTLSPRSTQEYDLYSCNNDGHLYQCNVNNRGVELVRRYSDLKFALNNAAISHDGKTLIASGDSNKFAIYRQNELAGQFFLSYDNQADWGSSISRAKRIPRFALPDGSGYVDHIYEAPGGDHGFYSSFSENDLQFATLFQNGVCLIYDVRNMGMPLAEISSTRPHSHNGAFRVCKFSYGLDDLLFISEHQGRVHVVDTRNFMNHQVILIPDKLKTETEISSNTGDILADLRRRNAPMVSGLSPLSSSSSLSTYGSTSRRRHSLPTSPNPAVEPWLTTANSVPLKYLEPQVVPYPRAFNKLSNNFSVPQPWDSDEKEVENVDVSRGVRRRSSFRVRRFSTSSNISENAEGIDPAILGNSIPEQQHYQAVDNYNYPEQRTGIFASATRDRASSSNSVDEDDIYDAYADVNSRDSTYPISGRYGHTLRAFSINSTSNYYASDSTEENNISGIDWVEDCNGCSLVIGTDYGIMKWNINSWARRSFSSYDFC